MKNQQDLFIDVIPLTHLPRKAGQIYTYRAPAYLPLKKGQLVKISLQKRVARGVIYRIRKTSPIPYLKKIEELLAEEIFITNEQFALAEMMSKYYIAPITLVMKSFLPQKLKTSTEQPGIARKKTTLGKKKEPDLRIDGNLQALMITNHNADEQIAYLLKTIGDSLSKQQQVLLLFPTLHNLAYWQSKIEHEIPPDQHIAHHSKLNQNTYTNNLFRTKHNPSLLIFALRQGLFLPFNNLGLIIMVDNNHIGYKQWEQKPTYHSHKIVSALAKIYHARIIYTNAYPSITDWHDIKIKKIKLVKPIVWKKLKCIKIADLSKGGQWEYSPLNNNIEDKIKETKTKQSKWLFLLNRLGHFRLLTCHDCGWQASCQECRTWLVNHNDKLICHRCRRQELMPPFCPSCKGAYIKKYGIGIQRLAHHIAKLNPNIPLILYNKENNTFDFKTLPSSSVIVATDAIFSHPDLPLFNKIVIVNADFEMNHPDWQNIDRFIQKVWRCILKIQPNGNLYLQTSQPNNLEAILTSSGMQNLMRRELNLRKQYKYPPYSELILLQSVNPEKVKTDSLSYHLAQSIKRIAGQNIVNIYPEPVKISKGWQYSILIKTKSTDEIFKEKLYSLVPANWHIDVNPLHL